MSDFDIDDDLLGDDPAPTESVSTVAKQLKENGFDSFLDAVGGIKRPAAGKPRCAKCRSENLRWLNSMEVRRPVCMDCNFRGASSSAPPPTRPEAPTQTLGAGPFLGGPVIPTWRTSGNE
jgi:hypothetical protein